MTDKVTIQPKSKPEKTTISISGETSERLEIYCRANGILRKEFVSLALEVLQEENDRLRNEIKVLQEYKEKAHRELCRVRDEQKTFGKIKVKTEFNL